LKNVPELQAELCRCLPSALQGNRLNGGAAVHTQKGFIPLVQKKIPSPDFRDKNLGQLIFKEWLVNKSFFGTRSPFFHLFKKMVFVERLRRDDKR
jgi:hypothetical protein